MIPVRFSDAWCSCHGLATGVQSTPRQTAAARVRLAHSHWIPVDASDLFAPRWKPRRLRGGRIGRRITRKRRRRRLFGRPKRRGPGWRRRWWKTRGRKVDWRNRRRRRARDRRRRVRRWRRRRTIWGWRRRRRRRGKPPRWWCGARLQRPASSRNRTNSKVGANLVRDHLLLQYVRAHACGDVRDSVQIGTAFCMVARRQSSLHVRDVGIGRVPSRGVDEDGVLEQTGALLPVVRVQRCHRFLKSSASGQPLLVFCVDNRHARF